MKLLFLTLLAFISITLLADDKADFEVLKKSAEQGEAEAQFKLGDCYGLGHNVAVDEKIAFAWYMKSAKQGHALAQYMVGWFYSVGSGVAQDDKKAVEWFTKASEQGEANAQLSLGTCYKNGTGVVKDDGKAFEWIKKSAEQAKGDSRAKYELGNCYLSGTGIEKNENKAVEWFTKASEQGDENAKKALKEINENDNDNTVKTDNRFKEIRKKLDDIIFDNFEFDDVSINSALRYFKTHSQELDPDKQGINIVLMPNAVDPETNFPPAISIKLTNVSARVILKKCCELAKLDMRVDPYAIVIGRNIPKYDILSDPLTAKKTKLSEIIIDQIDLEDATITAVVNLLIQRSKELDSSANKTGVNILLRLTAEEVLSTPKITMSLDATPLGEIFRYVSLVSGIKYVIKNNTVNFLSQTSLPEDKSDKSTPLILKILKTSDGKIYEGVVINISTPIGLEITHNKGVAFIDFTVLPEDLQKKYNYDPEVYRKYKEGFKDKLKENKKSNDLKDLAEIARLKYSYTGMYLEVEKHQDFVDCKNCKGVGKLSPTTRRKNDLAGSFVKCTECNGKGKTSIDVPAEYRAPKPNPVYAAGFRELAVLVLDSGDDRLPIKYCNIAIKLDPDNASKCDPILGNIYKTNASLLFNNGNYVKAKSKYEEARKYLPDDKDIDIAIEKLVPLAEKMRQKQELDEAIQQAASARSEANAAKEDAQKATEASKQAKADAERARRDAERAKRDAQAR